MKFDASLPPLPLREVPAVAKAAEEMGFAAIWTTETQHNPFLPHALLAEHTSKMRLGTAVAIAFARSPADLAYTAWDLAAASHGRFILGLGTQVKAHITRRFGMTWPDSVVGKLREQILAIRAFWNAWQQGEPLNFRGEYYKLTLMSPFFNPGPIDYPEIPIYIAGVNTGLARLAGEAADGFLTHPFHTVRYLKEVLLPAIDQGAEKASRPRPKIQVTVFVVTDEYEESFVRSQIAFYASTPSYRRVMRLHGWEETAERLSALASRGKWEDMPGLITDEMLHTFATVASPADLPTALEARYQGIADRLSLYTPFAPGQKDDLWRLLTRHFNDL